MNQLHPSRRKFLRNAAVAASGIVIVPRHVLGRGFLAPSDRLVLAAIGAGGKGADDLKNFYGSGKVDIAALCDVDDRQSAKSVKAYPKAKYYKDFREMLDKEHAHIDAVSVSTPDNIHAIAAMAAVQLGKHVYVQKPMTHDIYEARMLTEAVKKYKVVAQMGNQGSSMDGVRLMQEWYQAGLIGDATAIHVWTNRPVWPQGFGKPTGHSEIPPELNWNLWLGPAAFEEYHKEYLPFNWRGFWAFGTGALGDMGCHLIDPAFKTVGLGYPSEVECSVTNVVEKMWNASYYPACCPISSSIKMKFPGKEGKPDVALYWMDGGLRPERPEELGADEQMGDDEDGGVIITGTRGKMMCGTYGLNPTLLPTSRTREINVPQTIARVPEGHYVQWVNACIAGYGNHTLSSPFEYAGPLTETILMGNLALRSWNVKDANGKFPGRKKLLWDAANMKITNFDEANQFVRRQYRQGW
ncbi:MAG: Gfo/Idh/MocA family oxidoreductase [Bacteroidota bacterium]|nr:Gfo/Idh/MocA family oxidoreductase [Bacteroidota bacterium]MDP4247637.1 Gfo/Idh/MocA family oxidoreductase [Bacteroidota bacterium]MDP4254921.1 Gfo/Idh/MocA family oxidoreductase [Bacteroidota bacterium]MDP4259703.1 Gfo/Idh/MocA family oxidoreductase [Bacteroidota bacterium]